MIPSGSRVIRETYERKNRAVVVGTFFAGNKIGLTLGIPLASAVLLKWGWQSGLYRDGVRIDGVPVPTTFVDTRTLRARIRPTASH